MKNYAEGFEKLVEDPALLSMLTEHVGSQTDYPKAPQGLRVYWDTLCNYKGWKLQKNYYFDNCRIVDENNIRRVWGRENDMMSALKEYAAM
jgi:hypothetical protein